MESTMIAFPSDFVWGAATSSYQIEGACREDGRGPSIWDTFCNTPGKVRHGDTGEIASDHYHRVSEDLAIMRSLGLKAYRFSVAWPRIQPDGKGPMNPAGLDFYDRLVDRLLEAGIRPFVTAYHWDLPQALQDEGGWANRQTAQRFADYTRILVDRLGERVKDWVTHNEPWVTAMLGHYLGIHAPGQTDIRTALQVSHNLLLSHGLAVRALRSSTHPGLQVGLTLNLGPVHPASPSEADRLAARLGDGFNNRLFLDPVFTGKYPEDLAQYFGPAFPETPAGDMALIHAPLDFLGINYYTRAVVAAEPGSAYLGLREVLPEGNEYSQMWEIYPDGLYEMLTRVRQDYNPPAIYITENGIPVADGVDHDGRVRDYRRTRYVRDHLERCHRAIQAGVPLKGYFHWSLLDNFEWAFGYDMRFGMVHVNFKTQERTIKESGRWYAGVIRAGGFDPADFHPC